MNRRNNACHSGGKFLLILCFFFFAAGIISFDYPALSAEPNSKWGYINTRGKFVIKPTFDDAHSFAFQMAYVKVEGAYRLIDEDGQFQTRVIKDDKCIFVADTDYGVTPCLINGHWRMLNASGKRSSFQPDFSRAQFGLLPARIGNKYGFIDRSYKFVIPAKFDYASIFACGLAAVRTSNHVGYIDNHGVYKISPTFLNGRGFHDDLAAVRVEIK